MPVKRALLIGINRYPHYDDDMQLSGCVNDARLIRGILLENFGFDPANIHELHDEQASRVGILEAMERLVDESQRDDVVVFHFSGHGRRRQARLRSNTELRPTDGVWFDKAEGTGYDSTLMPSDTGPYPHPHLDITDNTIHQWLERLTRKTRHITLIFDACHSGTITRSAAGTRVRSGPPDTRALPEDADAEDAGTFPASLLGRKKGRSGWLALSDRYVVISSCRDSETAKEIDLEPGEEFDRLGMLSFTLGKALRQARAGDTHRDVFEVASRGVNDRFDTQHPQIEGDLDREVFGTRRILPVRHLPVIEVLGDGIVLAGGAVHGLAQQTHWDIFEAGIKDTAESTPLAQAVLRKVGPFTSAAALVSQLGAVTPGARGVAQSPDAGVAKLRVALDESLSSLASELGDRIARCPITELVDSDVDLTVKQEASGDDRQFLTFTRHGEAVEIPPLDVRVPRVLELVEHNLETAARYRHRLGLQSPPQPLAAEFNLYRVDGPETLVPAEGGAFSFTEGDRLAFEVINREERPVFVSILNFGLTGAIRRLYPRARASEMIVAGGRILKGASRAKLRVHLRGFHGAEGRQHYKAVVASAPVNLEWCEQPGMRFADTGPTAQALDGARLPPRKRSSEPEPPPDPAPNWVEITRSITVRRRPQ
ncbi:MAG: caspase family protein [Pseudomonadota bacterium]